MNSISLVGNLTKAPESRSVGDTSVCTLRIAVNRRKKRDGSDGGADYFDVKVWGNSGEACQKFLDKGSKVSVVGRLQIDEVDRKDGAGKAYFTSIIANEVQFLTPKGEGGAGAGAKKEEEPEDLGF